MITRQSKNPFSVCSIASEHTATELAVGRDSQVLAFPVLAAFSAGRATGLQSAVIQFTHLFQFGGKLK